VAPELGAGLAAGAVADAGVTEFGIASVDAVAGDGTLAGDASALGSGARDSTLSNASTIKNVIGGKGEEFALARGAETTRLALPDLADSSVELGSTSESYMARISDARFGGVRKSVVFSDELAGQIGEGEEGVETADNVMMNSTFSGGRDASSISRFSLNSDFTSIERSSQALARESDMMSMTDSELFVQSLEDQGFYASRVGARDSSTIADEAASTADRDSLNSALVASKNYCAGLSNTAIATGAAASLLPLGWAAVLGDDIYQERN
jgi:hypothetical protein